MGYETWGRKQADPWGPLARFYGVQEQMERPSIDMLVEFADARADDEVVDLATGTGIVPSMLAALPSPPKRLIGIDSSAPMIARAKTLPRGWSLRVGDALRTELPNGCATLVTCAWFLHLLSPSELSGALAEMRRLLTPDGRAVIVVPSGTPPHGGARVVAPIARFVAARRGLTVLRPIIDLDARLRAAGLRNVTETTTLNGWPARVLRVRPEHAPTTNDGA